MNPNKIVVKWQNKEKVTIMLQFYKYKIEILQKIYETTDLSMKMIANLMIITEHSLINNSN